jgi:hypothetical protein
MTSKSESYREPPSLLTGQARPQWLDYVPLLSLTC